MMEKITSYEDFARYATAYFKPGCATNCFITKTEAKKYIDSGKLYNLKISDSVFILKELPTHNRLYYYLAPGDIKNGLDLTPLPDGVVTETAMRERDSALISADAMLEMCGFIRLFYRRRMTQKAEDSGTSIKHDVRASSKSDFPAVRELLYSCFSPITGCIPDDEELINAVKNGWILLCGDGKGLLHYEPVRGGFELRHLCVREDCRGSGIAGELVRAYHSIIGGAKSQVWVREGYAPAEAVYEKNGYVRDGYFSSVLMYN